MKNYNEIIKNATTKTDIENVLNDFNTDFLDGKHPILDRFEIDKAIKKINVEYETIFNNSFATMVDIDRKTAFTDLIKTPNFDRLVLVENENKTLKIDTKKALFKIANLEKAYQLSKATETNSKGEPKANKSVTIFGAMRFYSICDCFIRNLFTKNLSIDDKPIVHLENISIGDDCIFTEKDNECFICDTRNSNNKLNEQANILTKFFAVDVTIRKKDLPILAMSAQKIKRDIDTNKASIHEINTLKFAETLFAVICSRYANEDIKVYTNNGKVAETVTETETVTA